jgi:hypothetical protein
MADHGALARSAAMTTWPQMRGSGEQGAAARIEWRHGGHQNRQAMNHDEGGHFRDAYILAAGDWVLMRADRYVRATVMPGRRARLNH